MKSQKQKKERDKDKEKNKEKEKEKEKDKSLIEDKKAEKINPGDNYISYNILKEIIKESNVPKKVIEEKNSELFYETLTGKGSITFINNTKFTGYMKNGLLESGPTKEACEIIFEDGTRYEGEIHQNKITGKGKYYFPSGSIYEGYLLNGLRNGVGKYVSPEGITYEGEWRNGLKHGKGIMKRDSMTYEGEWKDGSIYGYGKIKWENGNLYDGQFKKNHIFGDGYMVWYDLLEKYIGKWKNDKQNGLGIHIWYEPKGELKEMRNRYVGEWEDGIRHGYGVFFYSNGAIYEGEWRNNMKHGFGIMKFEDGKTYIGRFEEDRILDKENQINAEMINKLNSDYKLNKINEIKEEGNNEPKNKVNNINNIYQIIQQKKFEKVDSGTTNKETNLFRKKELVKLKSISSKHNSKINDVSSKDLALNNNNKSKDKDISMISDDKSILKNSNLKGINNVTNNSSFLGFSKLGNLSKFLKTKNSKFINISVKLQKFLPIFDLSDLIKEDSSIKADLEEISKIILRNLSFLKTIYRYLNKIARAELISEDTNCSKLIFRDDLKPLDNPNTTLKKRQNTLNKSSVKRLSKQATNQTGFTINLNKINKVEDSIRSDELSFGITMLDVWSFLRDGGILNEKVSICEFDRFFALGNSTIYETYLIPEEINEPKDIYEYIYDKITENKNNFIYKYNNYLEYYYRDSKIPKTMRPVPKRDDPKKDKYHKVFNTQFIHDKKRIILSRIFHECIIRAGILLFSKNKDERSMKLSKKVQKTLNILIPVGLKKKNVSTVRTSQSKLEQSANSSVAFIDTKSKMQEYHLSAEFMQLFFNELKHMFDKLYLVTNFNKPRLGDKTILYREFYNKIILHKKKEEKNVEPDNEKEKNTERDNNEDIIRKLVPNKLAFIEMITNYFKDKTNLNNEEIKKNYFKFYEYINNMLSREMVEFEFDELIFLICKKYFNYKGLKGTYKEYKVIINILLQRVDDIKVPQNMRKKYCYPVLNSHITKQRLIDEENARIEAERKRRIEKERYLRERELMDEEEKINAYNDRNTMEEEDSIEDIEDDMY